MRTYKLVAECTLHGIVGTFLTTEISVDSRENFRPSVVVKAFLRLMLLFFFYMII